MARRARLRPPGCALARNVRRQLPAPGRVGVGSRVAIVGSRHFPELERVEEYVRSLPAGASIVTGSASGVDAAATKAARGRGLHVQVVAASFDELRDAQRAAERNRKLIGMSDVLVAFWDGSSEGTKRTIERALEAGKEIHVFLPQ